MLDELESCIDIASRKEFRRYAAELRMIVCGEFHSQYIIARQDRSFLCQQWQCFDGRLGLRFDNG
jgi:hypothetical protein